jgi:hypothetical protein
VRCILESCKLDLPGAWTPGTGESCGVCMLGPELQLTETAVKKEMRGPHDQMY